METLDSENWQVVVAANNHPTESGNQILVQNKQGSYNQIHLLY